MPRLLVNPDADGSVRLARGLVMLDASERLIRATRIPGVDKDGHPAGITSQGVLLADDQIQVSLPMVDPDTQQTEYVAYTVSLKITRGAFLGNEPELVAAAKARSDKKKTARDEAAADTLRKSTDAARAIGESIGAERARANLATKPADTIGQVAELMEATERLRKVFHPNGNVAS